MGEKDTWEIIRKAGFDYLGEFKVRNAKVWFKTTTPDYETQSSNKNRLFVARQDGERLQIRLFTFSLTQQKQHLIKMTLRDIINFDKDSSVYLENIKATCSYLNPWSSKEGTAWLTCKGKRPGKTDVTYLRFRPGKYKHFYAAAKIADRETRLFAQYFRNMLDHCTTCTGKTVHCKTCPGKMVQCTVHQQHASQYRYSSDTPKGDELYVCMPWPEFLRGFNNNEFLLPGWAASSDKDFPYRKYPLNSDGRPDGTKWESFHEQKDVRPTISIGDDVDEFTNIN